MEAGAKERLYRLVDQLPDGEVHTAERFLAYLAGLDDPLVRALVNAPEVAEPLSDEDREALEEGRRALESDDVVTDDEVHAELGT